MWLSPDRVEESLRDHREMLAALSRKDAARFEAALFRHVEGGKGDYQRVFPIGGAPAPLTHSGPRHMGDVPVARRRKEVTHA